MQLGTPGQSVGGVRLLLLLLAVLLLAVLCGRHCASWPCAQASLSVSGDVAVPPEKVVKPSRE